MYIFPKYGVCRFYTCLYVEEDYLASISVSTSYTWREHILSISRHFLYNCIPFWSFINSNAYCVCVCVCVCVCMHIVLFIAYLAMLCKGFATKEGWNKKRRYERRVYFLDCYTSFIILVAFLLLPLHHFFLVILSPPSTLFRKYPFWHISNH